MHFARQVVITYSWQSQAVCTCKHKTASGVAVLDDVINDSSRTVVAHTRLVVVLHADNIFRIDGFYICRACLDTVDTQLHTLVRKSFDGVVNWANHDTRNLQVL